MATNPIIKHQRVPMKHSDLVNNLIGHSATLTTVNISSLAHPQILVSTTKAFSASFLIQVFSYSYDGVIHTDSYVSDI